MEKFVTIRAKNGCLCDESLSFFWGTKFRSELMFKTTALGYLVRLMGRSEDWVVSIDEDAFVWDQEALDSLMEYMKENDYVFCGPSEWVRRRNPAVVNPFFMVLNVGFLRELFDEDEMRACVDFEEDMKRNLPERLLIEEASYVTEEAYYSFFYWMLKKGVKTLYLDAERGIPGVEDGWATVVKDHRGIEFMAHAWYSREYKTNPRRIDELIEYARKRKEVTNDSNG